MGVSRSPEAVAARRARDNTIVQRWISGESQAAIAQDMGLSYKGVSLILSRVEREWRASRAEALRAAAAPRPGQNRAGRPTVWPDCPPDLRAEYLSIRRIIGSAAAKAQLQAIAARRINHPLGGQ